MGSTDLGLFSMGSIRVWTHEPISRVGCQWVDTRARVFYQQSECNCEELHNYMEPCRPCCGGESKGRGGAAYGYVCGAASTYVGEL